jgi:hypothetical protein
MKQAILMAAACLASTFASAQTSVLDGPAAAQWYKLAQEIQLSKHVTKEYVLHPPPCEFPPNLMDTLKKYDWLDIGSYHYSQSSWSAFFNEPGFQKSIETFDASGNRTRYDAFGVNYYEKEHIETPRYNPPFKMTIQQKIGRTFFCYDDGSLAEIISYSNGVLIWDNDDGGAKITDRNYPRRFRKVWIAVPRVR